MISSSIIVIIIIIFITLMIITMQTHYFQGLVTVLLAPHGGQIARHAYFLCYQGDSAAMKGQYINELTVILMSHIIITNQELIEIHFLVYYHHWFPSLENGQIDLRSNLNQLISYNPRRTAMLSCLPSRYVQAHLRFSGLCSKTDTMHTPGFHGSWTRYVARVISDFESVCRLVLTVFIRSSNLSKYNRARTSPHFRH